LDNLRTSSDLEKISRFGFVYLLMWVLFNFFTSIGKSLKKIDFGIFSKLKEIVKLKKRSLFMCKRFGKRDRFKFGILKVVSTVTVDYKAFEEHKFGVVRCMVCFYKNTSDVFIFADSACVIVLRLRINCGRFRVCMESRGYDLRS